MTRTSATTEVAIVGAGPAGTATAIALRRLGVRVTLLDRERFPRDKVCGDVLLPEAQQTLAELGLDTRGIRASAYECTGVRYVPARGTELTGVFRDAEGAAKPWWMVRRRELDAWLLREAENAGARVLTGFAVSGLLRGSAGEVVGLCGKTATGEEVEVHSGVVVGADGASSLVARQVGAFAREPKHTCIAARAYVEDVALPNPYLEVFTTPSTLPGCAWIAPVGPSTANVGIGIVLATSDALGPKATPQTLFDEIRRTAPLLASRLGEPGEIRLRGWTLPAATECRRMAGAGWVLVGDAAALVDPFTGHGIQNALTSGIMAAGAIGEYLADGARDVSHLGAYERQCRSTLEQEVGMGAFLQRLHAQAGLMHAITATCARHSGLRDTFVGLVGHAAPRSTLLSVSALARASLRWREGAAA